MRHVQLGGTGLPVSSLCLGTMTFGLQSDEDTSRAIMDAAFEAGVTFFDTADVYPLGGNWETAGRTEEVIGRWLRGRREDVVLASKACGPMSKRRWDRGNSRKHLVEACEASLKRLNTDYIDLYYQHRVDAHVPIEETVGAMAQLVEQGKVRYLGLSEANPSTIRRAHAVHPIAALQTEYSLWSREPEKELLDTCRELNITFVAYSPLGRGFLTGHITNIDDLSDDDRRRVLPRFQGENLEKNIALVRKLEILATAKGITTAQLALAWVWAQGKHIIPLVGTKRRQYLEENLGALQIMLTEQDLLELQAIAPHGVAAGTRYPDAGMQAVNR